MAPRPKLTARAKVAGDREIPDAKDTARKVLELPVDVLEPNPDQPRKIFEADALERMAETIRERGVIQPLLVEHHPEAPGRYRIIAGERRWRASKVAERATVPCVVREGVDDGERSILALLENVQREDLSGVELANAYHDATKALGVSAAELGRRLGLDRRTVSAVLSIRRIPEPMQEAAVEAGWSREAMIVLGQAKATDRDRAWETLGGPDKPAPALRDVREAVAPVSRRRDMTPDETKPAARQGALALGSAGSKGARPNAPERGAGAAVAAASGDAPSAEAAARRLDADPVVCTALDAATVAHVAILGAWRRWERERDAGAKGRGLADLVERAKAVEAAATKLLADVEIRSRRR